MMMPANYSAVAEELVYGGAVADYLPSAWKAENVKTLSTNVITILSNTFTSMLVGATLGTMFGGNWDKDGDTLFGDDGTLSALLKYPSGAVGGGEDKMNGFNKFMRVLGLSASVYTLGTTSVKNTVKEKKFLDFKIG